MYRVTKLLLLPAALVTGALLVAACGSDSKDSTPSAAPAAAASSTDSAMAKSSDSAAPGAASANNDADVTFAQEMIVHHRGAVEMAKLAGTRAASPDVKALAAKIAAAQEPEIATMSAWLKAWGKDVPKADSTDTGGMGHGGGTMPGMMTQEEMAGLEKSTSAAFDSMFLEMMIKHHEGAITMAKDEQAKGQNPDAKALAAKIVTDQTAEIAVMAKLKTAK